MLILALRGHSSHTVTENTGREVKLQLLTVVCVRRLVCVCARVCTYVCVCDVELQGLITAMFGSKISSS